MITVQRSVHLEESNKLLKESS